METVADGMAPHPTLSEAIKEAGLLALGRAIHFPNRKPRRRPRHSDRNRLPGRASFPPSRNLRTGRALVPILRGHAARGPRGDFSAEGAARAQGRLLVFWGRPPSGSVRADQGRSHGNRQQTERGRRLARRQGRQAGREGEGARSRCRARGPAAIAAGALAAIGGVLFFWRRKRGGERRVSDGLFRRAIADLVPYEPGKPVEEVQRELGLDRVVKLASNEGPVPAVPGCARGDRARARATSTAIPTAASGRCARRSRSSTASHSRRWSSGPAPTASSTCCRRRRSIPATRSSAAGLRSRATSRRGEARRRVEEGAAPRPHLRPRRAARGDRAAHEARLRLPSEQPHRHGQRTRPSSTRSSSACRSTSSSCSTRRTSSTSTTPTTPTASRSTSRRVGGSSSCGRSRRSTASPGSASGTASRLPMSSRRRARCGGPSTSPRRRRRPRSRASATTRRSRGDAPRTRAGAPQLEARSAGARPRAGRPCARQLPLRGGRRRPRDLRAAPARRA